MAEEVTVLYLGPEFADAAPIAAILFLGVPFRTLTKVGDAVVRAKDALWAGLVWKTVFLAGVGAAAWTGMQFGWGVIGVAWGVLLAAGIQFVGMAGLVAKTCNMPRRWWRALQPGALLALGFAAAAAGANWALGDLPEWWGRAVRFGATGAGGFALALSMLRWFPAALAGAHPEWVAKARRRWGWP
jgi:O-antigen/teichoic acid export membrane protein